MRALNYLVILVSIAAISACAGTKPAGNPPPTAKEDMAAMDMGAKPCAKCKKSADSLDALLKAVQEARKSDDKAKMAAALQRVEDRITAMKAEMKECEGKMAKMMGGMGKEGGMKCEKMPEDGMGKPDSTGAGSMPDKGGASEHEQHHH